MGKKAARRAAVTAPVLAPDEEVPVVGGREPCPCGSGRRYKACHGRGAGRAADALVRRPFEGVPSECDWVALREVVPAATSPLALAPEHAVEGVEVRLATVLPMAWPALRRESGEVLVGLQTQAGSGDVSRDVAHALLRALAAEPGTPVPPAGLPGPGPRLQDVLDPSAPLRVTVHEGFDFWVEGADGGPEVAASLERANAAVVPTERLTSVEAAYWCRLRDRAHLRWVLPHPEEALLDALARLHAAGASGLGGGTRFVGSFRAHGLLVPVWDLPLDSSAEALEEPAEAWGRRLDEALASSAPLTEAERGARAGLLNRQLTLR
ncbi:DUF5926 family protein [Vallicoccus soli]|uniref:Topoisomerase II n=1 Tax=Vallicoccus soli TaxID=2339232 RepID=A0A3A3YX42_9ACTN|nr:DUF5926 family protein [Vallicoccus soli]RJK94838.1 topoisomerase II [Vallicoccus soli]